jgi:chromosome segregation ATPase
VVSNIENLRQNVASLSADLQQVSDEILSDLREVRDDLVGDLDKNHRRISHLEGFKSDGIKDLMEHSDALYSLIDQRLDRVRRKLEPLEKKLSELQDSINE